MVSIDHFTKWIETKVLPSASAVTMARFVINQMFCKHRAPLELLRNRGSNFTSGIVKEIN